MNTDQSDDRRSFTRINFSGEASVRQGDKVWSVKLIDLSLKGLLIEENNHGEIDKDKPIEAEIQLNENTRITMLAKWRHSEDNYMGLECKEIDLESISHLRRLVELNLGDNTLLERELSSLSLAK